jgi:hypothetical protein
MASREVWFHINDKTEVSVFVEEDANVMAAIKELSKSTCVPILHFSSMTVHGVSVSARESLNSLPDQNASINIQMEDPLRRMSKVNTTLLSPGKLAQSDVEKVIEECKVAGIEIKRVQDDASNPIHDARCNHVGKPFAPERVEFLKLHTKQFYDPDKQSYSTKRPLSLALTWGQYNVHDIGRAIKNIQHCE